LTPSGMCADCNLKLRRRGRGLQSRTIPESCFQV